MRLRVSDLDQWVRFIEPERPEFEVTTEAFLAYMRREASETEDMRAGSAFHALLERACAGDVLDGGLSGIEQDGFRFHFGDIDHSLSAPLERETLIEKTYATSVGPVLLRGKLDGRTANVVTDYKLSKRFDAERYAGSMQWRSYLDMTGATHFRYVVFQARRDEEDVFVYAVHEFDQWAYPEMSEDVARRVGELAEFVRAHLPEMAA